MIGRHGAGKEDQRRIAIAGGQVTEDLIVSAILFNYIDDVFEGWIGRKAWSAIPIVGACDPRRELDQLPCLDICRHRGKRAAQLSESIVVTIIRHFYVRCWEVRIC